MGQRFSACTCPDDPSHPGPKKADGTWKARSAPELDIIEAQVRRAGDVHRRIMELTSSLSRSTTRSVAGKCPSPVNLPRSMLDGIWVISPVSTMVSTTTRSQSSTRSMETLINNRRLVWRTQIRIASKSTSDMTVLRSDASSETQCHSKNSTGLRGTGCLSKYGVEYETGG
jgi:hypothetical protein